MHRAGAARCAVRGGGRRWLARAWAAAAGPPACLARPLPGPLQHRSFVLSGALYTHGCGRAVRVMRAAGACLGAGGNWPPVTAKWLRQRVSASSDFFIELHATSKAICINPHVLLSLFDNPWPSHARPRSAVCLRSTCARACPHLLSSYVDSMQPAHAAPTPPCNALMHACIMPSLACCICTLPHCLPWPPPPPSPRAQWMQFHGLCGDDFRPGFYILNEEDDDEEDDDDGRDGAAGGEGGAAGRSGRGSSSGGGQAGKRKGRRTAGGGGGRRGGRGKEPGSGDRGKLMCWKLSDYYPEAAKVRRRPCSSKPLHLCVWPGC